MRSGRIALMLAVVAFAGGILLWGAQWRRTFAQERVLAVARPIPPGRQIQADDLTSLSLPRGAVPAGALRRPDQAAGRWARSELLPGEPLLSARLAEANPTPSPLTEGRGLLSVPVTPATVLAGDLQPGDTVQVLIAAPRSRGGQEGQEAGARVLLRDIPVVDVRNAQGFSTQPGPNGRAAGTPVPAAVIVAVSEQEALTLVEAVSSGTSLYLYVTDREEDRP